MLFLLSRVIFIVVDFKNIKIKYIYIVYNYINKNLKCLINFNKLDIGGVFYRKKVFFKCFKN